MSFFSIARSEKSVKQDAFDTPLLEMTGRPGNSVGSCVLIFLAASKAEDYIEAAGWRGEQQMIELGPTQLVKWLQVAKDNGATHVAMNAHRYGRSAIPPQELFELADPLLVQAELLERLSSTISQTVKTDHESESQ